MQTECVQNALRHKTLCDAKASIDGVSTRLFP
jgi:hypothetical protein